ncbi:uncharacterized protein LOC127844654 [Dreissena polymorpha]|uniref:uncharacterized protein LOC127844654 n=1 Tax=Dreissena polymorpha TaxID=45954 RepID=UPI00226404C2|nr:uncharacterized protein LOC127844654 [Dreissena polymorpha]
MLLGFDIQVNRGKSALNMADATLIFDGQTISLGIGSTDGQSRVAEVRVGKRRVIPPNLVMQLKCTMPSYDVNYVVESFGNSMLLVPRVVLSAGSDSVLCLVNPTDRFRMLKKNTLIKRAFPVAEYLPRESLAPESGGYRVQSCSLEDAAPSEAIPEHVRDLYERSGEHLQDSERKKLAALLNEYQDVFAQDEFDLGSFTSITHTIDTGNAFPVKERMRRTPVCFVGEEESHLEKMLRAGVIQESAPVLIRKRDGTVRWCIDYRKLNDVTIKNVFPLPLIDDCLDTLAGNVWFSKLDANSAYWQMNIAEQDRKKTALVTVFSNMSRWDLGCATHQPSIPGM